MKKFLYTLFLMVMTVFSLSSFAATRTFQSTGNWSNNACWALSTPPSAGDFVVINAGVTCTVDVNTVVIDSIAVYGTLSFTPNNASDLKYTSNFTIYTTGNVNNQGSIEKSNGVGTFTINGNGTYIHNPYNNVLLDESIFYN